jgi:hypothetical protein
MHVNLQKLGDVFFVKSTKKGAATKIYGDFYKQEKNFPFTMTFQYNWKNQLEYEPVLSLIESGFSDIFNYSLISAAELKSGAIFFTRAMNFAPTVKYI